MKYRLPVMSERSVREAETTRTRLARDFDRRVRLGDPPTTVTCQRGCHHCCYHPVLISVLEGISIFRWLAEHGHWTHALKRELEGHHRTVVGLDYAIWMLSLIPCPFLKEGECDIYEGRPFFCRTTYSTGDPYYCHPHRFGDASGIVSKIEVLAALNQAEESLLQRHQMGAIKLPLSSALLLGESVSKGDVELEEVGRHIWKQWAEADG